MTIAVVAEKPTVARDIAKVLGTYQRGTGYLHGNGYFKGGNSSSGVSGLPPF